MRRAYEGLLSGQVHSQLLRLPPVLEDGDDGAAVTRFAANVALMNYPPRTPSRASTISNQDSKAQHAALSGATKAFGRPTPQQRTSTNYTGRNGALAAASTVGSQPSSPQGRGRGLGGSPTRPLVASSTGGSVRSVRNDVPPGGPALTADGIPHLRAPTPDRRQHSKSPSLQAASLAASRATPQPQQSQGSHRKDLSARTANTSKPAAPPKPRRLSDHHSKLSSEPAERPTDETPIPPTTSLVNLFEQSGSHTESTSKRPDPIVIKPAKDLAIKSPKPVRTSGGLTAVFQMELPDVNRQASAKASIAPKSSPHSSPDSFASASETAANTRTATGTQPVPQNAVPPVPPKQRRPKSPPKRRDTTAKPIPVKEPPTRSLATKSTGLSPSSASIESLPAQFNRLYPRGRTPQMDKDQLANAMVASSLASSRRPSPQHTEPPPPPARRQRHHTFGFSRTPSPSKGGMRQTLRKAESDEESDEEDSLHPYGKHKKKRHIRRKHPNKHNEGDRKRWRDAVTERERKRYEGVWAANKGLHCSFSSSEQALIRRSPTSDEAATLQESIGEQVSSMVARDIWSRSRLPEASLEHVWDLVDNDGVGRLSKVEFVVGMWLIDQVLKGRKLPVKVTESVWASVRGLQGIKIRKSY